MLQYIEVPPPAFRREPLLTAVGGHVEKVLEFLANHWGLFREYPVSTLRLYCPFSR
jgi:hypothetical protein